MTDLLDTIEGPHAHVPPPVLVLMPDPDARVDVERAILGLPPTTRLTRDALASGFSAAYVAPGTHAAPDEAQPRAAGEPVGEPALLVFESAAIHPALLRLMVEHPLESDERFTLYDEAGRPTAWFTGQLEVIPSRMPISEELPWPEDLGPADVARVVYGEDAPRAEALVLRGEQAMDVEGSAWRERAGLPTVRVLANVRRPVPQLELGALLLALLSAPLSLWGNHLGFVLAGLSLLLGVHIAALIGVVRKLQELPGTDSPPPIGLARATRPLGHAAATAGLTYVLVAETDRSGVAALVLLAVGGGAALLSLLQARRLLHQDPEGGFALPDIRRLAGRVGVRVPRMVVGAPLLELMVAVTALTGRAELPWSLLVAGGLARLWRWFAGPAPDGRPSV